ncbi:MAG: CatB-related O-acetyltransferase [Lachnospiraceae bacterium]|nr:CatB-related O-acetyltransferase [Lachnospiraceae bacterium]
MYGDINCGEAAKIWDCEVISLGKVKIGIGTAMNHVKIRQACNDVTIGNYCSIGEGTRIIEFNHKVFRLSSSYYCSNIFKENMINDIESKGNIVIQDDVWIGNNCMILSGVKIGRGAVIGAGSIVTKDVEPYTINAGNPCHKIRDRFDAETKMKIEDTKWWEENPESLHNKREVFDEFEKIILSR